MSTFTRCIAGVQIRRAIRARTLPRIAIFFAVGLAFGLGHLYLRFSLDKARLETYHLQTVQGSLLSDINILRGQNYALTDPARIYEAAHADLGMVAYNPAERETLTIPEDISTRYAMARAAHPSDRAKSDEASNEWLQALGERVVLTREALAREGK